MTQKVLHGQVEAKQAHQGEGEDQRENRCEEHRIGIL